MKMCANKKMPKKIMIAHRGLWNELFPENSLEAFDNATKNNLPIELDVHILKDNTLIVFHDDNLKRMTGKDCNVKDLTYDEIKKLYLKNTKSFIPTLKEVLDLVDGKVLLDIEIKTDVKNFKICRELCKTLDLYTGKFMIKSFNPLYIIWMRIFRPHYIRGLLVSSLKKKRMNIVLKKAIFKMWLYPLAKPDFIAFDMSDLPNKKIEKLKKRGIPIYVWTIKDNVNKYNEYDGIIFESIVEFNDFAEKNFK